MAFREIEQSEDTGITVERGLQPVEHPSSIRQLEGEVRIDCYVVDQSGAEIASGMAYAIYQDEEERTVLLSEAAVDKSALATLMFDFPGSVRESEPTIHVGVVSPGYTPCRRSLSVRRGQVIDEEFMLERGRLLSGWVVDPEGRPVAELPVYVTSRWLPPMVVSSKTLANRVRLMAPSGSDYCEARATTDSSGWFQVSGLETGSYGIVTESTHWFMKQEGRFDAGANDVRIVAVPALCIDAAVKAAADGSPVPACEGSIEVKCPSDSDYVVAAAGGSGRWLLTWPAHGDEVNTGFEATLTLGAEGFQEHVVDLHFDPQVRRKAIRLSLLGIEENVGEAVLNVVKSDGTPCGIKLQADLVGYPDQDVRLAGLALQMERPGRFILRGPAGQWFVRVFPEHKLGRFVSWFGEVLLTDHGKSTVWGALPAYGMITIPRPAQSTGQVSIESEENSVSGVFDLRGAEMRIEGLAVGLWRITANDGSTREVYVGANDEVLVEW